jgi:predicted nucleic acid-binding protein
MIVVDASVATKWFLAEDGTPLANALLDGTQKLIAPALIRIEVHAAITRRFRTGDAPEDEVRQACRDWIAMIEDGLLTLLATEEDEPQAVDLTVLLKHAFQDCLYLALAQRLRVPLVTADSKFIERTAGRYPSVLPLGADAATAHKPKH